MGDQQAGRVAQSRHGQHADDERRRRGAAQRQPAHHRAEQDGEKRRPFDQRVARPQFLAREMVGQDAVFDGAEQRAEQPEGHKRCEQKRQRFGPEPGRCQERRADLEQFQAPGHQRLVETVGELPSQRRYQEKGGDERAAGQRYVGLRTRDLHAEQDKDDQRVLEDVVVERRQELAPEERREALGREQGDGHARGQLARDRHSLARNRGQGEAVA